MNTNLETALIVLVVVVVVLLVVLLAAVLFQLWRSAKNMAAALVTINHSLPSILKNIEELTDNVNKAAYEVKGGIEQISSGINKVQAAVSMLDVVKPLLYSKIPTAMAGKLMKLLALFRGMKVFLAVLQTGKEPAVKTEGGESVPIRPVTTPDKI